MAISDLTRRSFMKLSAFAGAAVAAGVSAAAIKPTEKAYADGQDEVVEQKTFCRACPRDCAVIVTIRNGVVQKVRGNPDDFNTGGRMCAKGLSGVQALYHPNRTKYPMKRIGERGVDNTWERISWEEAVDMVAGALDNMAKKTGRNGLLITCGGGGNPKLADTLGFMYYWGAGNTFEPGAAQCSMPRTFMSFGMLGACRPGAIGDAGGPDVFNPHHPSPCAVVWGAGPASCSPASFGRNYVKGREAGMKTIVVDPRFSTDAARADVWVPLRAGTDVCMMNAWIKWLIDNEKYDKEFVTKWSNAPFLVNSDDGDYTLLRASMVEGVEIPNGETYVYFDEKTQQLTRTFPLGPENETSYNPALEGVYDVPLKDGRVIQCKTVLTLLREYVQDFTLEYASEVCHCPVDNIERALDLFGNAGEGRSILSGVSIDQHINSGESSMAMCILNILVGSTYKPGSGCADGPSVRSTRYRWGSEKGRMSNMSRTERGCFNPNVDKDGNPKRYATDSYGNPRPLADDGLPEPFEYYNYQSAVERFGYIEHKGLGYWAQCLNAGAGEAMRTGDPYPVKVWIERSGNKFATVADMGGWLEGIKNLDFAVHHYMYPTSFTFEVADVILPTAEWMEMTLKADAHGTISGVKVACAQLFEDVDDRFIYGTYFKCLADNYHDERAYHVYYDDDEYYSIYDYDEFIEDMCATDGETGEKLTWEETKALGAYAVPMTEDEYWDLSEKTYYTNEKIDDDGLYKGFFATNERLPLDWSDIEELPRKQMIFHDWLVHCGRHGADVWGELPPASEDYFPLPKYIEPADSADPEIAAKYPLFCSNGRLPFFHHSTLRNAPFLRETYPAPEIWIDPQAAAERGIETGDWVNIKSARCETSEAIKDGIYAIAWVTEGIAPGCCYMERFWNPEFLEEGMDARKSWTTCNYNALARREGPYNPSIGSYTLRGIGVEIAKSSKPEGIWYEPQDFEPWMPQATENTGGGYRR